MPKSRAKRPKSRVKAKAKRKVTRTRKANQPPRPGTQHMLVRHVPLEVNALAQARAEQEGRTVVALVRHWLSVYAAGGEIPLPTYVAPVDPEVDEALSESEVEVPVGA